MTGSRKASRNETRYPWKDAPEWAMWAATDDDGRRFFFRYAPIRFDGKWLVDQPLSDEFSDDEPEPCPDWRDSLEARPAHIAPAVGVTDAEVEAALRLYYVAGDMRAALEQFLSARSTK